MKREHIDAGRSIHRRTGKTFYLATRFFPKRVRHPTYALYGFFRLADDVVDTTDPAPAADQYRRLDHLRAQALGETEPTGPVLDAFRQVREEKDIPAEEVELFCDAMAQDIETDDYETLEALEGYMRGSAAAVGVMMTHVMMADVSGSVERDQALPHAMALGEAFQLTNFLRDVREDVRDLDRVYLPAETLDAHGVSVEEVRSLEFSPAVGAAVADLLQETERRYRTAVPGIRYLPKDCQFPVLLASVLYAEHHRLIRERDFDVLSTTPSLSTVDKLSCLVRTRWHWFRTPDPETVFRRVSAVPAIDSSSPRQDHPTRISTR